MSSVVDIGTVTADDFEARRGTAFQLQLRDGELPLTLHAVRRLGQSQREAGAFSLTFVAAPRGFLPQAIYTLVHAEIGTLQLFLVPIGPTGGIRAFASCRQSSSSAARRKNPRLRPMTAARGSCMDPSGPDIRVAVAPAPGTLVAFRAETTLEIIPVTHGERFTVVTWFR